MTNQLTRPLRAVVVISVRSWFDSHYGNTYHSYRARFVDCSTGLMWTVVQPFRYSAASDLDEAAEYARAAGMPEWLYPGVFGVVTCHDLVHVGRRRDMHAGPEGKGGRGMMWAGQVLA